MGDEDDYEELDGPRSPSLWELTAGSRPFLFAAGLLLSLVSCGSCAVTVDPAGEVWRSVVMVGCAILAAAAFITVATVRPRP